MHLIARRLFFTVTLAAIAGQATPTRLFAQVQDRSYYMKAAGMEALGMTYSYVEVAGGGHSDIVSAHLSEIFEFFDEH